MSEKGPVDTILAVERALIILKNLAETEDEMGVRDIGRELGYSPAVTQKILNTLRVHGFVKRNEQTQQYTLGPGVLHVGLAVLARLDVVKVARPHMEDLTTETEETTFLAIQDDLSAVYIDIVKSPHPIRMDAEIGAHRPLNCTAVGKVLLAWGPKNVVSRLAEQGALIKSTSNSIVDPDKLQAELKQVREQNYAIDCEEYNASAMCVASPIFGRDGKIVAAITTSGPSFRMKDRIDELADMVKSKAAEVSTLLGYSTS